MVILRMQAVLAEMGHRSPASIYQAIRAGLFTRAVRIGARAVGWPADEVHAINVARVAGNSDLELKRLVCRLHASRTAPCEGVQP
jgi:prophage regulatory protein